VARDTSDHAPALLHPARSRRPCAPGTALPDPRFPGGSRLCAVPIPRVQIASPVCRTVGRQEQPPRRSQWLQGAQARWLVVCDQHRARRPGHKPPGLTHLLLPVLHRQHHQSSLCGGLRGAVALRQGPDALPTLPSSPTRWAEGGRSLQKGVGFERLKSSLAEGMRQSVDSRSPGQSSRKRGKKVQLGNLKSNEDTVREASVLRCSNSINTFASFPEEKYSCHFGGKGHISITRL